jgi:Icc-related predicted phosphoesterase
VIRLAAAGDVHFGLDSAGTLRPHLDQLPERADVLLLTGDLTRHGEVEEAAVLAQELEGFDIPVVTVLGNHDYHGDQEKEIQEVLEGGGMTVLEGEGTMLEVGGRRLGVAGTKGFGGGFVGANATDFGEPEMKAFVRLTKELAAGLEEALEELGDADYRVALMHYSPIKETLEGEPPEIWAFLGSYLLGEAADRAGCDLILHGHAHRGTEKGITPGGIQVRNVAQPVIQRAYRLYCFEVEEGEVARATPAEAGAAGSVTSSS